MKFSVIIPVYNAQKHLKRCVDSILEQDYNDYEIILVNDGSTDRSIDICNEYVNAHENIILINKENAGASSARNVGLDNATGNYILFVDSDDCVTSNFFEEICNKQVEKGISIFNYTFIKGDNENARKMPNRLLEMQLDFFNKTRLLILSRTVNSPVARIYDRTIIEKYNMRFDERMPVAEDFNFNLLYLSKCEDIKIYNIPIYKYFLSVENSLITRKKEGLIDIYPIVFDEAFKTVSSFEFNDTQKAELYKILDKLHTDSFATCIMEELKGDKNSKAVKKEIALMCEKFYSRYSKTYGYCSLTHFLLRKCIKYKMVNTLFICAKLYVKVKR